MDCAALLLEHRSSILDESYTVLERSHVHHYEAAGEEFTRARLEGLFDLVVTAIGNRDLAGVSAYAVNVAEERFKAGFDISEVQAAFNAIEEAMWRQIVESSAARGPRRGHRADEHRARLRQGRPGAHLRVARLAPPRALARPDRHVRRHPGPPGADRAPGVGRTTPTRVGGRPFPGRGRTPVDDVIPGVFSSTGARRPWLTRP